MRLTILSLKKRQVRHYAKVFLDVSFFGGNFVNMYPRRILHATKGNSAHGCLWSEMSFELGLCRFELVALQTGLLFKKE